MVWGGKCRDNLRISVHGTGGGGSVYVVTKYKHGCHSGSVLNVDHDDDRDEDVATTWSALSLAR